MLSSLSLLAGGCILLYYGARWLVKGAAEISVVFRIPKAIVGLTLVAVGTSAPELFVNVIAAYNGKTGFALANVAGSNLTNLCVGFGACGIVAGVMVRWRTFLHDLFALVLSAALPLGILLLPYATPRLPLWAFVPLGVCLLAYLFTLRRRAKAVVADEPSEAATTHVLVSAVKFAIGGIALYGGGKIVLTAAVAIAEQLEIGPALIGLTIVAAGTSVPDAIASVVAAQRGEHDIAVGNLLGSNIANVLVVVTSTIVSSWLGGHETVAEGGAPVAPPGVLLASGNIVLDYATALTMSLVFVAIAVIFGRVTRRGGLALIACYLCYMSYRVFIAL